MNCVSLIKTSHVTLILIFWLQLLLSFCGKIIEYFWWTIHTPCMSPSFHMIFFFFLRNRPGRSNIYIIFLQLLHFVKNRTSYILISLKLVPKKKKNGAIEGCSQLLHYSRNLESSSTNSFWNPQQRILNPQDKEKFWNFMNLSN